MRAALTLLLVLFALPAFAGEESGWVGMKKFPQGEVLKKAVEGTSIHAVRARGTIAAPWPEVRAVVLTPSRFEGVMPHLEEEKFLETAECAPGGTRMPECRVIWVYNCFNPPVVRRRDGTLRVELTHDELSGGGTFELNWKLDPSRGPKPKENATRMVANRGRWTLTADGDVTRYTYEIETDPGGSIPAWATNVANGSEVPRMIGAIEEAAKALAAKKKADAAK